MKLNQIEEAARCYGTPLYIFDVDILRGEMKRFRSELGEETDICYVMRANPFLVKQMAALSAQVEVTSMAEFLICKKLMIPPEKMLISGVMKKKEDIWQVLDYCREKSIYTIESANQLEHFINWCNRNKKCIRIYLRLTSGNQFGMEEEEIREIIDAKNTSPYLKIEGIHYFSGVQRKSLEMIQSEIQYLDVLLYRLVDEGHFEIQNLMYGPGITTPHFQEGRQDMFQEQGVQKIAGMISSMRWKGHVTLGVGQALVSMCGYYVTQIKDIKHNKGINYCIVDGVCHQLKLKENSKDVGQPVVQVHPSRAAGKTRKWTICGALAAEDDVFCKNVMLKNIEIENLLIFKRTGAYPITEDMGMYVSHFLPNVVLYGEKMGYRQVCSVDGVCVLNGKSRTTA